MASQDSDVVSVVRDKIYQLLIDLKDKRIKKTFKDGTSITVNFKDLLKDKRMLKMQMENLEEIHWEKFRKLARSGRFSDETILLSFAVMIKFISDKITQKSESVERMVEGCM